MSGSSIIQDGKLVGAVTHVLVNDPTRGYGIFGESQTLRKSEAFSKWLGRNAYGGGGKKTDRGNDMSLLFFCDFMIQSVKQIPSFLSKLQLYGA